MNGRLAARTLSDRTVLASPKKSMPIFDERKNRSVPAILLRVIPVIVHIETALFAIP